MAALAKSSAMHYNRSVDGKLSHGRLKLDARSSRMSKRIADKGIGGFSQTLTVTESSFYAVHIPAEIDVRAIRGRLGLTQQEFATRFGFSVNTVRHWEQGRRIPEAPTRAYLLVIDREPQAVEKALRVP